MDVSFRQVLLLLVTGMTTVYHGMMWKDRGENKHAFWTGMMVVCTIINLKPFV